MIEKCPVVSAMIRALISNDKSLTESSASLRISAVLDVLNELGLSRGVITKLNEHTMIIVPVSNVRHYKGGHYVVFGEGIHTETEEKMTLYQRPSDKTWYARPVQMFNDFVEEGVLRFTPFSRKKHFENPVKSEDR